MVRIFRNSLVLGSLLLALTTFAQAQATRTFISGVGNDADPCSRTAPCRTWSGAFIKTFINGEINALDPGGYGGLNITKSITLDGNGTHASTLASGITGFTINIAAGNVNDPHRSVRLRNLSINGTGPSGAVGTRTGIDGVRIISAADVHIDNVLINDFSQDGVEIAAGATVELIMNDVIIRNCSQSGLQLDTTAGEVVAQLDNVRVQNCATGIDAEDNVRLGIKHSVFTHNTNGIRTIGNNNILNIEDVFVAYATTGVRASPGSTIRISNSMITQNSTGINANGGTMTSLNGNTVFGNTLDGLFTASQSKL